MNGFGQCKKSKSSGCKLIDHGSHDSEMADHHGRQELGSLEPETTAFFLCDVQERFRPHIKYFSEIVTVAKRLVDVSELLGLPLVVTEQYPNGLGRTVAELNVEQTSALVFPKTKFSMIITEVEARLGTLCGGRPVKDVILFGVEAHVCIQQTCLDLLARNISVHVIADATSSRSQMDRMFALERLRQAGAVISTSESTIFQLIGDKDHPKFKEVQKIVMKSAPISFPHMNNEEVTKPSNL